LALIAVLEVGGELFEVQEFQRVREIHIFKQRIDFLLPLDLRELLAFYIVTQLIEILEPTGRQRFRFVTPRIAADEQVEQRVSDQRGERVLTELAAGERHGGAPGRGVTASL